MARKHPALQIVVLAKLGHVCCVWVFPPLIAGTFESFEIRMEIVGWSAPHSLATVLESVPSPHTKHVKRMESGWVDCDDDHSGFDPVAKHGQPDHADSTRWRYHPRCQDERIASMLWTTWDLQHREELPSFESRALIDPDYCGPRTLSGWNAWAARILVHKTAETRGQVRPIFLALIFNLKIIVVG